MRVANWQIEFEAFCKGRVHMPFEWGKNDCVLFAADCVLALTGKDPAQGHRGYTTALQAARLLRRLGGVHALATAALGKQMSLAHASIGDIVVVNLNGIESLGVCNGSCCMGPAVDGFMHVELARATAAWRVG